MRLRIFAGALALLFGTGVSAADWQQEKPCATRTMALKENAAPKCLQSYCADVPRIGRLCVCIHEDAEDTAVVTLRRAERSDTWLVEVMALGMSPESFVLRPLASNGPDANNWLFAMMQSQSNGMGVQSWDVRLITPQAVSAPRLAADFGALSQLTQPAQGGTCRLLSGQWMPGWDRKRGDGLYFVAEWFEARDGQWQAAKDMPMLHRRYLNSFQSAREAAMGQTPARPLRWYSHADAQAGPAPVEPRQ